jgi:diguanylate cyclase (GGDEF)-like protein
LFIFNLWFVLVQIVISIISILAIENYSIIPIYMNHIVQILYFLSVPLLPNIFLLYIFAVIWEGEVNVIKYLKASLLLNSVYLLFVFSNPLTQLIYHFDESGGFVFGDGFFIVYLISNLYAFAIIAIIYIGRKRIDRNMRRVLLSFPILIIFAQIIQGFFPHTILTGSAATAGLLISYLYFQNKMIYVDMLTGINNRKAFTKELTDYMIRKRELEIILVSMDDFKDVNDNYGQQIGDSLLKAISKELQKLAPKGNVYRYSGDEFVILIEEQESNKHKKEALIEVLKKNWIIKGIHLELSASICVLHYPKHANSLGEIVQVLEYGIGLSKKQGKGKVIESSDSTIKTIARKNLISTFIKKAIKEKEFEVYFQPIYSMKENRFTAAEALLRLKHDELGVISPGEFIPIAEEIGIMPDLNYFVIENVCIFINRLIESDIQFDFISLNMSNSQVIDNELIFNMNNLLKDYGVDAKKIYIEITESIFIDQLEEVNSILNELGEYGYRFCIDDFGTGYSNITNIISLPVSVIKIDKSIVYKSMKEEKNSIIIQGIAKSFANVGFAILTEGVENPDHLEIAKKLMSDYVQGFFFAFPLPKDEAIRYMGKRKS